MQSTATTALFFALTAGTELADPTAFHETTCCPGPFISSSTCTNPSVSVPASVSRTSPSTLTEMLSSRVLLRMSTLRTSFHQNPRLPGPSTVTENPPLYALPLSVLAFRYDPPSTAASDVSTTQADSEVAETARSVSSAMLSRLSIQNAANTVSSAGVLISSPSPNIMPVDRLSQPPNSYPSRINAFAGSAMVFPISAEKPAGASPVPPFASNETATYTPQSSLQSGSVQTLRMVNGVTLPPPSVANPAAPVSFACANVNSTAEKERPPPVAETTPLVLSNESDTSTSDDWKVPPSAESSSP